MNHDGGDQRGDSKALIVSDGLYSGAVDCPMGVETQWPELELELHSPESSEASRRLAVPVGHMVMDGTVSPSATDNERVDTCLRRPLDGSIEGGNGEDQSQTLAVDHRNISALDAIPFNLRERSIENSSSTLQFNG